MTTAITLASHAQIQSAIATAADKTGIDFDYLLATAKRESGLKTQAKSKTSSASGLFQFIDQTWLSTVKSHGAKYGLKGMADQIERGDNGRFNVADPAAKEEILALRHDPKVASLMAGELTRDAANLLQQKLGRAASKGELYMAHFLGATGAARFISASEANPEALAAQSFGREASANRSVFFESSGAMRTLSEVYDRLTKLHGSGKEVVPASVPISALAQGGDAGNTPSRQEVSNTVIRPVPSSAASVMRLAALPAHLAQPGSFSGLSGNFAARLNSSLGGITSTLTPQVLMILSSLEITFKD
jgi:transglycosylase-like protein with SLT domain